MPYKEFCVFPRESYFIKAIENFFPVFAQPDINTRGVGRILDGYANPRLRLGFAQLSRILPTLLVFYIRLRKHGKRFLLLKCSILCVRFYVTQRSPIEGHSTKGVPFLSKLVLSRVRVAVLPRIKLCCVSPGPPGSRRRLWSHMKIICYCSE